MRVRVRVRVSVSVSVRVRVRVRVRVCAFGKVLKAGIGELPLSHGQASGEALTSWSG